MLQNNDMATVRICEVMFSKINDIQPLQFSCPLYLKIGNPLGEIWGFRGDEDGIQRNTFQCTNELSFKEPIALM